MKPKDRVEIREEEEEEEEPEDEPFTDEDEGKW